MAPLICLVVVTLSARLAGQLGWDYAHGWPAAVAVGLAAMFVVTGVAHFTPPLRDGLITIVPPWLPAPGLLVTMPGGLVLPGGVGFLTPQPGAAPPPCLALLLVAMFPANVYAAGA